MMAEPQMVVVSAMSGAGRSTAMRTLEDLHFYCIDNIPNALVGRVVDECVKAEIGLVALGFGVRGRSLTDGLEEVVHTLEARAVRFSLIFLDATDDILLRRFSTTRRPHPLEGEPAIGQGLPATARAVIDAIALERRLLAPIRAMAHQLIDTSDTSVHELRRRVIEIFGQGIPTDLGMRTRFLSFGFKYGAPLDADVVLDVRFIDNPYFVEPLRRLSGKDEPVRKYVLERPETAGFLERATALLTYTVPLHQKEGKRYLTVGIGCTGGRHRSVAIAEHLARQLGANTGIGVAVSHRDIHREASD